MTKRDSPSLGTPPYNPPSLYPVKTIYWIVGRGPLQKWSKDLNDLVYPHFRKHPYGPYMDQQLNDAKFLTWISVFVFYECIFLLPNRVLFERMVCLTSNVMVICSECIGLLYPKKWFHTNQIIVIYSGSGNPGRYDE